VESPRSWGAAIRAEGTANGNQIWRGRKTERGNGGRGCCRGTGELRVGGWSFEPGSNFFTKLGAAPLSNKKQFDYRGMAKAERTFQGTAMERYKRRVRSQGLAGGRIADTKEGLEKKSRGEEGLLEGNVFSEREGHRKEEGGKSRATACSWLKKIEKGIVHHQAKKDWGKKSEFAKVRTMGGGRLRAVEEEGEEIKKRGLKEATQKRP